MSLERTAMQEALAQLRPNLQPAALERLTDEIVARWKSSAATYTRHADDQRVEQAYLDWWDHPTVANAQAFATASLATVRRIRSWGHDRRERTRGTQPPDVTRLGPYEPLTVLGFGADGLVLRAEDTRSGTLVALKINARGDTLLADAVGADWPPFVLRTLDTGHSHAVTHVRSDSGRQDVDLGAEWGWVVRELADATLADVMEHFGGRLPIDEALEVFRVCAGAVAWCHDRSIYNWSAHTGNVFLVGDQWKIGDFGRMRWCLPTDHPLMLQERREAFGDVDDDQGLCELADWLLDRWCAHWTAYGRLRQNVERERRFRLGDCASLAGLLVEMLTGRKWEVFFRALNKRPYCSARYELTGDSDVDEHLSAVVNRAWRGDAGGALLAANAGRGEQTVYDDARELLAAVEAVFSGVRAMIL